MKLRTALGLYREKGPDKSYTGISPTGEAIATRVVHLHLSPSEIQELTEAWEQKRLSGLGSFYQKLDQVEKRLRDGGYY